MQHEKQGYFLVAISAMFFGTIGLWVKWGYHLGFTPPGLLVLRFGLACLFLWATVLINYGRFPWLGTKQTLWLAVQGAVGYGFTAVFFFLALENLPAGMASMLFYLHPLVTAALTPLFFGQSIDARTRIVLVLAVIGSALLAAGALGGDFSTLGIVYALIAAIAYSGYSLAGQLTTKNTPPLLVTAYTTTACFLAILLWHRPSLNWLTSISLPMWGVAAGLAFVATFLGILLYLSGIKTIGANLASIISALEPATGVLLAVIVLKEKMNLWQAIGISLILTAVIGSAAGKEAPADLQLERTKISSN